MRVYFLLFSLFHFSSELPNIRKINLLETESVYSEWYNIFDKPSSLISLPKAKNKIYFLGKYFKVNFLQAHLFCKIMRMHLVTMHSPEENEEVKSILNIKNITGDFWTSGTRMLDGQNWIWMSTAKAVEYKNWGPGQPNNKNDHCIVTTKTKDVFIWNDRNCNCRFFFICEKPKNETTLYVAPKQQSEIRKYYRNYFD